MPNWQKCQDCGRTGHVSKSDSRCDKNPNHVAAAGGTAGDIDNTGAEEVPQFEGDVVPLEGDVVPLDSQFLEGYERYDFELHVNRGAINNAVSAGDVLIHDVPLSAENWPFRCAVLAKRVHSCLGDECEDDDNDKGYFVTCFSMVKTTLFRSSFEATVTVAAERKQATTQSYARYMAYFTQWLQNHPSPHVRGVVLVDIPTGASSDVAWGALTVDMFEQFLSSRRKTSLTTREKQIRMDAEAAGDSVEFFLSASSMAKYTTSIRRAKPPDFVFPRNIAEFFTRYNKGYKKQCAARKKKTDNTKDHAPFGLVTALCTFFLHSVSKRQQSPNYFPRWDCPYEHDYNYVTTDCQLLILPILSLRQLVQGVVFRPNTVTSCDVASLNPDPRRNLRRRA